MIIETAQRTRQTSEYYFSVKLAEVRKLVAEGHDVINLGIGNPDMMPSEQTLTALSEAALKPQAHGYQPYVGTVSFRNAIAEYYQRTYGVKLNPLSEILPLIGSKEGITHISLTFLDPGDEVLVPELGYPAYRAVSQMVGAVVKEYPLREDFGWQPDWEVMAGLVTPRTKIMWLNYPHMPTGAPATKELFEAAVAFAKKHKILLCHDNPYSLVLNKKEPISLLSIDGARAVAIELNSMSKSHNMAGWRLGWIAADKAYIDAVLTIKSNVDSGMFWALQEAAVAALGNPQEWHDQRNAVYQGRLEASEAFLSTVGCTWDKKQEGMFLWGKLPDSVESAEKLVNDLLVQKHVFIAPGFIFGPKGQRYIRLSLCMPKERIWEAVERLKS
ncbi:aminotransferase class I/II-fold pyridoxal phosphate-dependent enzyme [Dyadobacter sp. LHD-138]|uniref:pyridoxal phosphate-dependent aminotransferase n=1 Tax=Dyadobacter sp. LHD-138 TaxID=3071413 RepID=UPI0027E20A97|nr:aminotransferase class I/II-fold pyridoxal phosphate-dependent enzyme [Dyadobacter sp. LHD-138]MDQ6480896.1 aminotransferase class I/II-fold pyridoxal phosphate-dependent enzyme [Dyadobacter sp. LHD-138]